MLGVIVGGIGAGGAADSTADSTGAVVAAEIAGGWGLVGGPMASGVAGKGVGRAASGTLPSLAPSASFFFAAARAALARMLCFFREGADAGSCA
jgi:hypothetical protein